MVEVLIIAVILTVPPLLVISTTSAAACSPLTIVAAIATLLLLLVPVLVVSATLLLLAVRWIGNALVDAFLLVTAISPTTAAILLSATFRGATILVIVHLLFTLALHVIVLSFALRSHAVSLLKRASRELDHFKTILRLVGDHTMRG